MNPKSGTMLKAIIAKFDPSHEKHLLQFLPTYDFATLEKCITPETQDFSELFAPFAWMEKIHYSWFLPLLQGLPKQTAMLCLIFFQNPSRSALAKQLDIQMPLKSPSPLILLFLAQFLRGKLEKEDILPLSHLPPSPCNKLLTLTLPQLIHLIDLLGLYDLAAALRHVIDKNLFKKVENALTKEESAFLSYASRQPMKETTLEKFNLKEWNGERKTLLSMIQKKGLKRLALSLQLENKSMQWHLSHKLDSGRGEFLMKLFAGKEDPDMISYFRGQLIQLLTGFKRAR